MGDICICRSIFVWDWKDKNDTIYQSMQAVFIPDILSLDIAAIYIPWK